MIEVREAEYFVAVAEELHFGRAAERLQMSQPPLSQAIRQLERKVGVVLLHRTTRSVTLTSAGRAFLDEARLLIGASRSAQLTARRAGAGLAGELRVGAVASAFEDPLPRVVAEYRQRHPDIQLTLEEIDTHEAPGVLLTFRLDVVIARLAATPPGLRQLSLKRDRFVLVSPRSWPQRCSARWLRESPRFPGCGSRGGFHPTTTIRWSRAAAVSSSSHSGATWRDPSAPRWRWSVLVSGSRSFPPAR